MKKVTKGPLFAEPSFQKWARGLVVRYWMFKSITCSVFRPLLNNFDVIVRQVISIYSVS